MIQSINEILNHLEIQDLSGDTLMIAELVGVDTAKLLLQYFDGLTLTIQRVKYMDGLILKYLKEKYPDRKFTKREIIKIAKDINRSPRDTSRLMKMRFEE
ncbi:hypothetical protein MASR1M45_12400 [Candidatus Kapaibacterium sp.]